ncbi:sigma-70 family RNA polymerase sigma factor [Peribacillus butanolivorans]|uniref:sigma-70 family RNA polymerase sigma factor n=1 Tax=Peribacillus butanolivorans TaxID=421767 RepID=UPI0036DB1037
MKGGREVTDELVEKVRGGNDHAFRILIETYKETIFRNVYSVLRNQKDAEDATQEVFIKIYTSLPQYKNQGFKTWITRIAVNHAIDLKRKRERQKEESHEVQPSEAHLGLSDDVEAVFFRNEKQKQVLRKLNDLPEGYRDVVYGYYIQEKTFQQIAEEQQIQVKSVEVKLYRARNWMRKHWKEEDFS